MPFIFTHTVLVLILLIGAEVQAQQSKTTEPLNVMAFNIRYASATGANAWPKRRGGVVKVIADQKADLIGTQEGLHHQLVFMDKSLPDHKWIGTGREGGQRGEFMAIFYRSPEVNTKLDLDSKQSCFFHGEVAKICAKSKVVTSWRAFE